MPEMNGYCSLAELKDEIWAAGQTPDDVEDAVFNGIIEAVSRWIDYFTGTRFYTTSADETRYFTADERNKLFIDDLLSVTSLCTDDDGDRTYGTTWATTDYDLLPFNAALDYRPYRWIETTPSGDYYFPLYRKAVRIIGKFGFCTKVNQPELIRRACILQSSRIYKRSDAPFGVISNPLGGSMQLLKDVDPDVEQMIRSFKRRWV